MEEGLCTVRLDLRRAMNEQADSDATVDAKIEAECRKVTSELSIFRSQVAVRFNDCKEGLLALQADMRTQFEAERKRMVRVEDHLKIIERRLDGEQSRVAPLVAEQQRMQSLLDGMKSELRCTDTQLGALHGQIDRALGASTNTVESNKRMERTLAENAEYYDVELKFMRTHVTDTVASLAAMKAEKRTFVESVESRIEVMLNDLNNFVERLPLPRELFDVCVEYEGMWVRLHSEGIEGTAELQSLPDKLHNKVSQLALRIAHHIAAAADRLVLARWTAGSTAKKATTNPQEAPKLFPVHGGAPGVASSGVKSGSSNGQQRESVLTELQPESAAASGGAGAGAGVSPMLEGDHLTENMQVKVSFNMPSADLIEQVRDELFQNYLSTGFIALLRASDEALGPPGLLKSTGRATFQRKLKKAVEAALTKYPVMLDPAQASQAAALSLARSSKKQQLARFTSHTGQAVSLPKRLNTEFDTCVSCGHELAAQLHLAQSQQQQAQALVPDCSTTNNGMPVLQELIRPYSGIIRPPPINTDYSITYHINNNNNIHSTPSMASLVVPSHSPVQHPPPFGQLRRQDTPATPLDLFGSLDEGSSSDELNQQAQSQPGRPASPLSRISVTLTKKARPHSGTAPATATFASISNNARDSNNTEWSKLQSARSNKRPASASAALRHREAVKDAMRQQEQAEQQQLDMHNKVERGKIEQTFHHPAGVAAHLDHTGSECSDYDGRGAELQKAAAAVPRTGPDVSPSGSTAGMRGANPNLGKSTPSIPAHVRGFGGSAGGGSGTATSKSQSHSNSNFGTSPNMRTAGRESTALMHPVTAAVPSSVAAAPSSAVTSSATTGRAGSGFGMPVQPSQQGSNILAHQLAHRFQQDASFHGTAMRQVDSTDLLEPIQISRKLFGAHQ